LLNQQLNVTISVPIPEEYVLIKKIELKELQQERLTGVYWSMKDLEKRINKSRPWILENILYEPRFRKMLDSKNGGPVYYPQSQGENWSFHATKMAEFLDKNFSRIFN
jgi:phage pi2 protein 07